MGDLSPPMDPIPEVPPPEGWVIVTDCSCGELHLAPAESVPLEVSEYIDSDGVFHELP